jgi:ABC-2 type transport system ATP-binding protein
MLRINDLHFSIGSKSILRGISASFEVGKIYGILGKNGAGKTTLFRSIFGFYKPQKGSIHLQGKALEKNQMSFLETENYLYPYMRGMEYLQLIRNDAELIQKWNTIFKLPLDQLSQEYSTGMKKKLAFMGVLIQDRQILLLDEPFNGVDLESNEKMMTIIQKLKSEKTILVSSHILSTLSDISDHILVLEEGRFVQKIDRPDFEDFEKQLKKDIKRNIDDLLAG